MKCLFLDLGYDFEELDEPLGISVLASYTQSIFDAVHVEEFCANYETISYCELLSKNNPDIVAISTHVNTWERLNILYRAIDSWRKNSAKEILILIGGILGTYEYEHLLHTYPDVICMIGEGEQALYSIIDSTLEESSIAQIKGILINKKCPNVVFEDSNKDLYIGKRCVQNDLSTWNHPVTHKYLSTTLAQNGIVRMEASRGCPWNKCSFCVLKWKYAGCGWRPYSIEKVISELTYLSQKGAKTIFFTDEEFIGSDYDHLTNLIDTIISLKGEYKINPKIEFVASTSVQALSGRYGISQDKVFALIIKMKKAGFRSFFLGIESGSDSQLARFCKGITVSETEKVLYLLKKYEIETDVGYILFDPLMNIIELKESLEFLERTGLHKDISRFAKRLRVVPHTTYCDNYKVNKQGYNKESVEYYYTFNDLRIQSLYDKYIEWEKEHLSYTHKIQGDIRASLNNEKRLQEIQELKHYRFKEYYALKYLVECALQEQDLTSISVKEINRYCNRILRSL